MGREAGDEGREVGRNLGVLTVDISGQGAKSGKRSTSSASAARASAAVRRASAPFIHGSFKRFGEHFWTCSVEA